MRRLVLVTSLCLALGASLSADVRTDQKVKFQLGGALGKVVNMFGGKAAREGVTTMVAVKGDRKAVIGDGTGQIVDLAEEKVYDLDMKKKTYTVVTFAEIRKQMEKARQDAEKAREQSEPSKPQANQKDPNEKEFEVDFDIKNTAETRAINGFDTKKSVMTIAVREKGKTLDQSGGIVMTTDMWMAANAPSSKDLIEFERRYAEKVYGLSVTGASAQDMAAVMGMYPQMKPALDKMRAEGTKLQGTAILSEMRVEAVPAGTANQPSAAAPAPAAEEPKKKGGLGGMIGGLKKMAEQSQAQQSGGDQKPQRAIIMTTTSETLKLTNTVDAEAVAIPAGFTQQK